MFVRLSVCALICLAALPASASDLKDFYGKWKITEFKTAPWEDPTDPMKWGGEKDYVGKTVAISKGRIKGPDMMGCGKTDLSTETLPFAGLFEGGLATDPKDKAGKSDEVRAKKLATELGFVGEPVTTLDQGCSEITFLMADHKTLMFGLNDRIFVMKRQ
jgi:hypothetical protein